LDRQLRQNRGVSHAIGKSPAATFRRLCCFLRVVAKELELSMRALNLPGDLANVGKQRIRLLNCEDFH
jgi:hypothetical protein